MSQSITELESVVRARMEPELRDYVDVLGKAYNLLGEIVEASNVNQLSLSAKVQVMLAARLQEDLRSVDLTASLGYALAALTHASVVREVAYGMMYLDSDDRALAWWAHQKENKAYPECGHKDVLRDVLGRRFGRADAVDQEYKVYTDMCLAKHANPVLQREYGVLKSPAAIHVVSHPFYSADVVLFCKFALAHSIRAVTTAALLFATELESEEATDWLAAGAVAANDTLLNLTERDGVTNGFPLLATGA